MRRIPRPLRAIDPSACLHAHNAHHAQHVVAPAIHLRSSTAAFSTTPARAFLLPGKPNKKKHQQWVRRWQKRLLGDSEPIGAHVDPFDPTSPVRISPEEQGEYEEVLELPEDHELKPSEWYEPAENGKKLMRVGGEAWQKQKLEVERAREFEKLTLRTYTPMTLNMANEIEALTSTPYTLRDDNLYMAQTVHNVSGRPYTKYNFGLHKRPVKTDQLRDRFIQAVAEVYTLRAAGLNLDLAKSPNQGIYDVPEWVSDIKLHSTASGELTVSLPEHVSAEDFIEAMQVAPAEEDVDFAQPEVEEDLLVEEGAEAIEPVLTMDPATPEFKRAAVVKTDPTKKPFDFMSNRPVPRAKPAEPAVPAETGKIEEVLEVQQLKVEAEPLPSASARLAELATKSEASQSAVSELRRTVLERRAQRIAHDIAAMRKMAKFTPVPQSDVKWHRVPITDNALKFAIFKRLYQLTGYRISDFRLSTSKTLGDLYDHVFDAAKPKPKSLHSALQIEAHKARQRVKKANGDEVPSRKRADLGDLLVLGNVELRKKKASRSEQDRKKGMRKVINYALMERGLPVRQERQFKELPDRKGVVEGTRDVPQFGKPLSSKAANYLAEKIKQKKREEAEREIQG